MDRLIMLPMYSFCPRVLNISDIQTKYVHLMKSCPSSAINASFWSNATQTRSIPTPSIDIHDVDKCFTVNCRSQFTGDFRLRWSVPIYWLFITETLPTNVQLLRIHSPKSSRHFKSKTLAISSQFLLISAAKSCQLVVPLLAANLQII